MASEQRSPFIFPNQCSIADEPHDSAVLLVSPDGHDQSDGERSAITEYGGEKVSLSSSDMNALQGARHDITEDLDFWL
jgi:hypothetical protein